MTTQTQKKWLNKDEAAAYLGISPRSLRRLTEPDPDTGERRLPFYKPNARTVYRLEDLDAYMEQCRSSDADE
jgi:excisionase family DNA binding protein